EYHDAGDVFSTRDIRDVEGFDTLGKVRKLEKLLQLGKYFFGIGLEHTEPLLEGDPRVVLHKLDQVAFLAAFRIKNAHSSTSTFRQCPFKGFAVVEIRRHVDLERYVVSRVILGK